MKLQPFLLVIELSDTLEILSSNPSIAVATRIRCRSIRRCSIRCRSIRRRRRRPSDSRCPLLSTFSDERAREGGQYVQLIRKLKV